MGSRIIFHAGLGLPASVWITEINEYMAAKILQKIVNILSCVMMYDIMPPELVVAFHRM